MELMRQELEVQITQIQELLIAAIKADEPYEVARHLRASRTSSIWPATMASTSMRT